jgi:hypothetical protein
MYIKFRLISRLLRDVTECFVHISGQAKRKQKKSTETEYPFIIKSVTPDFEYYQGISNLSVGSPIVAVISKF